MAETLISTTRTPTRVELLDLYGSRGLLIEVDADGTVEEVTERIREALDERLGRR